MKYRCCAAGRLSNTKHRDTYRIIVWLTIQSVSQFLGWAKFSSGSVTAVQLPLAHHKQIGVPPTNTARTESLPTADSHSRRKC
jgi:hypothetical protein